MTPLTFGSNAVRAFDNLGAPIWLLLKCLRFKETVNINFNKYSNLLKIVEERVFN